MGIHSLIHHGLSLELQTARSDFLLPDGTDPEEAMREVTKDDGKKWAKSDDGLVRVPYTIPGGLDEYGRWAIARVVQEYAAKTCIRLVPFVDDPDIYPNPHIIFKSGGG